MTRLKAIRTGIEPAQRRDRTPEDYSCVVAQCLVIRWKAPRGVLIGGSVTGY